MDFADAMRAAIDLTRDRRLAEATRMIQHALAGRAPADAGEVVEAPIVDPAPTPSGAKLLAIAGPADAMPDAQTQRKVRPRRTARPLERMVAEFSQPPTFPLNAFKGPRARKPLEIPDGAQFLSCSFACAAGSRSYRLYLPSDRRGGKRPLVIMLHGGTQDGDDFAAGTRMHVLAEEHGLIVAYVSQSKAANASLCWNWFLPEHQMRERGEPSIIAGITNHIAEHYDIDPLPSFHRRSVGWRRHGGSDGRNLSRSLRRHRHPFRLALQIGGRCRLGVRSDAGRSACALRTAMAVVRRARQ